MWGGSPSLLYFSGSIFFFLSLSLSRNFRTGPRWFFSWEQRCCQEIEWRDWNKSSLFLYLFAFLLSLLLSPYRRYETPISSGLANKKWRVWRGELGFLYCFNSQFPWTKLIIICVKWVGGQWPFPAAFSLSLSPAKLLCAQNKVER